jgi:Tfp pilus assembly protein PilF
VKTWLNMARIYETQKDIDSAAMLYRRALTKADKQPEPYFRAAAFYARTGEFAKSDSLYMAGTRLGKPQAGDWFNWGLSYLRRKQLREGIVRMKKAIASDSAMYAAHYCLAAAFNDLGGPVDSVKKYLSLSLKYNPRYQPALRLKEQLRK